MFVHCIRPGRASQASEDIFPRSGSLFQPIASHGRYAKGLSPPTARRRRRKSAAVRRCDPPSAGRMRIIGTSGEMESLQQNEPDTRSCEWPTPYAAGRRRTMVRVEGGVPQHIGSRCGLCPRCSTHLGRWTSMVMTISIDPGGSYAPGRSASRRVRFSLVGLPAGSGSVRRSVVLAGPAGSRLRVTRNPRMQAIMRGADERHEKTYGTTSAAPLRVSDGFAWFAITSFVSSQMKRRLWAVAHSLRGCTG
jgi:hypothetical protein